MPHVLEVVALVAVPLPKTLTAETLGVILGRLEADVDWSTSTIAVVAVVAEKDEARLDTA